LIIFFKQWKHYLLKQLKQPKNLQVRIFKNMYALNNGELNRQNQQQ